MPYDNDDFESNYYINDEYDVENETNKNTNAKRNDKEETIEDIPYEEKQNIKEKLFDINRKNNGLYILDRNRITAPFKNIFTNSLIEKTTLSNMDEFNFNILLERFYKKENICTKPIKDRIIHPVKDFLIFNNGNKEIKLGEQEIISIEEKLKNENQYLLQDKYIYYVSQEHNKLYLKKIEVYDEQKDFERTLFQYFNEISEIDMEEYFNFKYGNQNNTNELIDNIISNYSKMASLFLNFLHGNGYHDDFIKSDGGIETRLHIVEKKDFYDLYAYYAYYAENI